MLLTPLGPVAGLGRQGSLALVDHLFVHPRKLVDNRLQVGIAETAVLLREALPEPAGQALRTPLLDPGAHAAPMLSGAAHLDQRARSGIAIVDPDAVFPIHPVVPRQLAGVADQPAHQACVQEGIVKLDARALAVAPPSRQLVGDRGLVGQQIRRHVLGLQVQLRIGLAADKANPGGLHQAQEQRLLLGRVVAPHRHVQKRPREPSPHARDLPIGLLALEHRIHRL